MAPEPRSGNAGPTCETLTLEQLKESIDKHEAPDVLAAFEFSGAMREALRAAGHQAISVDLRETEKLGPHIKGDVGEVVPLRVWTAIFFVGPD